MSANKEFAEEDDYSVEVEIFENQSYYTKNS